MSSLRFFITKEIVELEKVDEYLIRKIFQGHSKTAIEMFFLDTALLPIRYIIRQKRISYLHHILTRNENELISKVYFAQKRKPGKDDWVTTVHKDMEEIQFHHSDDDLKSMSKSYFKKILREKIHNAAFEYLQHLKSNHSKVKMIHYDKLAMQPYLSSNQLTTEEKQLLLRLRSSMINVKASFKSQHQDLTCNLCRDPNTVQTASHLLDCKIVLSHSPALFNNDSVQYEHIYGTVDQQIEVTRLYSEILQIKSKIEEQDDDP